MNISNNKGNTSNGNICNNVRKLTVKGIIFRSMVKQNLTDIKNLYQARYIKKGNKKILFILRILSKMGCFPANRKVWA